MGQKVCTKCKVGKPVSEFNQSKGGRPHSYCKECHRKYDKERYASRPEQERHRAKRKRDAKRKQIVALLRQAKDRPCPDCGGRFPYCAMDFDHRDPKTKAFTLGEVQSCGYSLARIRAEILKCDVVCANCHRIRTHQQSG